LSAPIEAFLQRLRRSCHWSFSFEWNSAAQRGAFADVLGPHYNYFRDYDAVTGRYVQSDPIGLGGGLSTYGYAGANPAGRIDPWGLYSTKAHDYFIDEFVKEYMPELAGQWGFIDAIKAGSRAADSRAFQAPQYAYMHAMSSSALSPEESKRMMCRYITIYGDVYRQMISSPYPGYHGQAYFALGMALHAAMDSTSPAHRGFQYWPDWDNPAFKYIALLHGGLDSFPTSIESLEHAPAFRNETLELMKQVVSGEYSACGCD
jgi:RHS repeat-associated protein